jgi:hypothetical protein
VIKRFEDGTMYDGEMQNDIRHGYGVLSLGNGGGDIYSGDWEND